MTRHRHLSLIFVLMLLAAACSRVFAGEEFIISYWWGPPATEDPDRRYAEVAECNFTHASFPGGAATVEQNLAILDACQKHGLKFIVNDPRILQFAPEHPQFKANLDAII